LDGVEDASEETLRFGSWNSAYIKFGAASVWDCLNINFRLKKWHVTVCASSVDTQWHVTVCANAVDNARVYNLIVSVNQQ
jgi:hypothetical protein